jgi:hypothetical protein
MKFLLGVKEDGRAIQVIQTITASYPPIAAQLGGNSAA